MNNECTQSRQTRFGGTYLPDVVFGPSQGVGMLLKSSDCCLGQDQGGRLHLSTAFNLKPYSSSHRRAIRCVCTSYLASGVNTPSPNHLNKYPQTFRFSTCTMSITLSRKTSSRRYCQKAQTLVWIPRTKTTSAAWKLGAPPCEAIFSELSWFSHRISLPICYEQRI